MTMIDPSPAASCEKVAFSSRQNLINADDRSVGKGIKATFAHP
jgi:hypothetical protein